MRRLGPRGPINSLPLLRLTAARAVRAHAGTQHRVPCALAREVKESLLMEVVAERPLSHRHAHQELFVARLTSVQYCCTALRAQASIPDSCTTTISIMYARWVSSDPILPLTSGLCVRGVDAGTVPLPARLFFGGMLRWSR